MAPRKDRENKPQTAPYIKYSGLAFEMLTAIGGGALLGYYVDERYSLASQPFTVVGSVLGIAVAFYQVFKSVRS